MGKTWRSYWQSRIGNWCCHLRRLSKIRQQKIGKRLPGWISLNVSCDFQANGVRLWCNSMKASIHPVFYQQFRLVVSVCVCVSLAHLRPLTDSWVSFGSVRLEPLSYMWSLLLCTEVTPLGHGISLQWSTFGMRQTGKFAWTHSQRKRRPGLWGMSPVPCWIYAMRN